MFKKVGVSGKSVFSDSEKINFLGEHHPQHFESPSVGKSKNKKKGCLENTNFPEIIDFFSSIEFILIPIFFASLSRKQVVGNI